jgi:hypothetical protein
MEVDKKHKPMKLIITPEGKAREINPLGEKPYCGGKPDCCYDKPCESLQWQEAESRRKTYSVDWDIIKKRIGYNEHDFYLAEDKLPAGSIVEAIETSPGIVKVISIIE